MALTSCSFCGGRVSTLADRCPHCLEERKARTPPTAEATEHPTPSQRSFDRSHRDPARGLYKTIPLSWMLVTVALMSLCVLYVLSPEIGDFISHGHPRNDAGLVTIPTTSDGPNGVVSSLPSHVQFVSLTNGHLHVRTTLLQNSGDVSAHVVRMLRTQYAIANGLPDVRTMTVSVTLEGRDQYGQTVTRSLGNTAAIDLVEARRYADIAYYVRAVDPSVQWLGFLCRENLYQVRGCF